MGVEVSTRSRRRGRYLLQDTLDPYLDELSALSSQQTFQWPSSLPPHPPLEQLMALFNREAADWNEQPAIFVSPPRGWETTPWEALASHLCGAVNLCPVRLSRSKPARRPELRLPLRLTGVGEEGKQSLLAVSSQDWYKDEIAERGLRLLESSREEWRLDLQARGCDILVLPSAELSDLRWIGRLPLSQRPRLAICSAPSGLPWPGFHAGSQPTGCAVLWVDPVVKPNLAADQIMLDLVHDQPLHLILDNLSYPSPAAVRLLADPFTNQGLRLRGAFRRLRRQGLSMEALLTGAQVESASKEEAPDEPGGGLMRRDFGLDEQRRELSEPEPAKKDRRPSRKGASREIERATGKSEDFDIGGVLDDLKRSNRSRPRFDHESQGLNPLSRMASDLSRARELRPLLEAESPAERPQAGKAQPPPRRVDAGLERVDTEPLLSPLESDRALAAGARYQLRVHVGIPLSGSLLQEAPPAIDPLLPDPDERGGHQLEITVQPKDFQLLSKTWKRSYLPSQGGSEPVYFTLRTPRRSGPAQLRFCVYCRNHLLQSFLLHAQIDEQESPCGPVDGKAALRVDLEHSATERFQDLDALSGRLLSIGANQNQDGSHELTVKGDAAAGNLSLLPVLKSGLVTRLRNLLNQATVDSRNRVKFYPPIEPGEAISGESARLIRLMAEDGSEMFRKCFRQADRDSNQLKGALARVRSSSDKVLQVVRFDENFSIPWPLFYDYRVPRAVTGGPPAPVCSGLVRENGKTRPCKHDHRSRDCFCVKGFWGVRHQIEELISGKERQRLERVIRTKSEGAVRIAIDQALPVAAKLVADLKKTLGEEMVAVGPLDDELLLDLLWETDSRPAVLILLGHLEQRDIQGELPGTRIVLERGRSWLREIDISERVIMDDHWDQPNTLVLLLACESAATDLKTLNDLVLAIDSARAAGIVGTEAKVGSRMAGQIAVQLASEMIKSNATLGQVLTDFRRRLLQSGNPLAFVFQCLGDAELRIVLGDS